MELLGRDLDARLRRPVRLVRGRRPRRPCAPATARGAQVDLAVVAGVDAAEQLLVEPAQDASAASSRRSAIPTTARATTS